MFSNQTKYYHPFYALLGILYAVIIGINIEPFVKELLEPTSVSTSTIALPFFVSSRVEQFPIFLFLVFGFFSLVLLDWTISTAYLMNLPRRNDLFDTFSSTDFSRRRRITVGISHIVELLSLAIAFSLITRLKCFIQGTPMSSPFIWFAISRFGGSLPWTTCMKKKQRTYRIVLSISIGAGLIILFWVLFIRWRPLATVWSILIFLAAVLASEGRHVYLLAKI